MKIKRYHTIHDLEGCNERIAEKKALEYFIIKLADEIEMTILEGPVVSKGIVENPGLSGFAIIDYSHISVHTFTDYDEVLVDVFSCKPYHQEAVAKLCLDFFEPHKIQSKEVKWARNKGK